ncbi:EAL domain-containing protein [Chiayiivirga flava]|uniref:PAS domain S-box-containing protein/diguanylate cyclase (GGDEF)-like protein n=1 Tax=Chiayiivirga flava TaxID=659595 RepID=A0A7W8D526_9GAMM|nr:EAL domain-containing protein [Chiayiivirga flava]MBB5208076.1 PAS domain S-box-containing protein/diguanylate cyclase (GGDEF)-like protein [Chiayiivirga flava]
MPYLQGQTLRVLLIEDSSADVDMVLRSLRELDRPFEHRRVASEADLQRTLAAFEPHVVLSDFSMPGFSGRAALDIVSAVAPQTPFIFVSGTIGEELAIEALQLGAADYVLKDNLRRLPASVERALRMAAQQQQQLRTERALRDSEERYRSIVESTADWIWEMDPQGRITYSNAAIETILGYHPSEMVGRDAMQFVPSEQRADLELTMLGHVAHRRAWRGWMMPWLHRDGGIRILDSSGVPVFGENGALIGYRGTDRDVTLRMEQDEKIRRLARIHAVLSALGNAILVSRDRDDLLTRACRLAVEQGEFPAAAIVEIDRAQGTRQLTHHHGDGDLHDATVRDLASASPDATWKILRRALQTPRRSLIREVATLHSDPLVREAYARTGTHALVLLPLGRDMTSVLLLHSRQAHDFDADEVALLERLGADLDHALDFIAKSERLEYLAYHNPLTGLPNRAAFGELVGTRLGQGPLLVAMFDVVHFHYFNDSRGRDFCNELLRSIGRRLGERLPASAVLAHPVEDSFAVVLPDGAGETARDDMARLIDGCCGEPFNVDGEHVYAELRCGLVEAPRHATDVEAIERNSLAALAEARNRNERVVMYSEALSDRAQRRIALERELRVALEANQFELFLQPKFAARGDVLAGAEALLRWRHPQRGLIAPSEFIPVLEDTGLIVPTGRWVMRSAIAIARRWREAGHPELRLAVNVSARELRRDDFVADSAASIAACGTGHRLDIEITESLLMENIDHSIDVLRRMRALGFRVHIDDFGTGYSSLNYLSRLPVDVLKIDQAFIAQIADNPESLALVTNMIGLAHALDLRVVAEGVEHEEQAKLLRLLRCDELQGFHLGRPMPVEEFERTLLAR